LVLKTAPELFHSSSSTFADAAANELEQLWNSSGALQERSKTVLQLFLSQIFQILVKEQLRNDSGALLERSETVPKLF